MKRVPTEKELFYERLGGNSFAQNLSNYDTQRRVAILVDEFFSSDMLEGKRVLDVGCGLGFFSRRMVERGANVVASDISPSLVEKTISTTKCEGQVADALQLVDQFGTAAFDVVVSSECIEHVPSPADAIRQMALVLKPGGYLSISTPNILWYPLVRIATMAGLRPFDGHENFSSWSGLRNNLTLCDMSVIREYGLHLYPFQLPFKRLSAWCDCHLQPLRGLMINICLLARKNDPTDLTSV